MVTVRDKLKLIRRYTGNRFSASKGYDLRSGMSKRRLKTIDKYFQMTMDLTSRPHKVIVPPRGAKREAFEYTGQIHHPKFTKAIVHIPDPEDKYTYRIDKTRPKGSRFIWINKRTKEKSWHVPARVFLDENENLYDEDEDVTPEFLADVIEEYAYDGEVYLIEAGDNHMWGSAGRNPLTIGTKLADLFKQYGAGNFNPYDRGSHFIGNWFRGISVYKPAEQLRGYFEDRMKNEARYRAHSKTTYGTKKRKLRNGMIGTFEFGKLVNVEPPAKRLYPCRTCHRVFSLANLQRHYRRTGH